MSPHPLSPSPFGRGGMPGRPRWSLGLVALLLTGCAQRDRIVVGSKNFTESDLLGEIVAQQIERRTGLPVERRFHLGGTFVCHQAITSGQIDLYVEYTGTAYTAVLKHAPVADRDSVYRTVARDYAQRFALVWGKPNRCARLRAAIRARLGQTVRIQQHLRHDRATPRRHALRADAHLGPDARGAALEGRIRLRVPGARRRLPGARERIRTAVRFPTHRDGPRADVSGARGGEGGRDRRQLDGRPDSGPGPRRVGGRPPLLPAVRTCAGDPAGSDPTAPGRGDGPRAACRAPPPRPDGGA